MVIILDFWATWCPPCVSEIPHFIKLYDKYKDKGLAIIGVSLDKAGQVTAARVAMGAVGPRPLLSLSAETTLVGKKPSDELIRQAARATAGDATPIDDHRGSVEYRRLMVEALAARTLATAIERAGGQR